MNRRSLALAALAALVLLPQAARAQTIVVKPYFMFILDTSGSMGTSTTPPGPATNSCGFASNRINDAKCALTRVVDATGDAQFGLEHFDQPCRTTCAGGVGICDDTANSALVRVGIFAGNEPQIEGWVDNVCSGSCASASSINELWAAGNTPISGALRKARCYYQGTCGDATTPASPVVMDPFAACRPLAVILLTDGAETCTGNPAARAADLYTGLGPGTPITLSSGTTINKRIRTYPIGFGVAPGDAQIEGIAHSGGAPDVAGVNEGFYAVDEASIAVALNQIIAASALTELCNNMDDNCNMVVDEGYAKYCSPGSGLTVASCAPGSPTRGLCTQCAPPAELCNGVDDNCNGVVDEGVLNACGACGPLPAEVCDGIDNNCNGVIDEGGVCGACTPSPEICDGLDNNCNGMIDEGLTRPCGTSVGACTAGTQICTAGTWGACSGTGPTTEICDGIDNDCNGVIDGLTRSCGMSVGTCLAGSEVCTAGAWSGVCIGAIGPGMEVCDGLDNNCNGVIDESDPMIGTTCGMSSGACHPGTIACVSGMLVCTGGTGPTTEVCDGIDNDCNGLIDDGLGLGAACGTSVGECRPGVTMCVAGLPTCVGETGPMAETCNGLDDDCNGIVDDVTYPPGATCGSTMGVCTVGHPVCSGGHELCVGATPAAPETCDCTDNDCDGVVDNPPPGGSLCPAGSTCFMCACSVPCMVTQFGDTCPTGRTPFHDPASGMCLCVAPLCDDATCAGETHGGGGDAGVPQCAPGTTGVPACVCKNNACTYPCDGTTCMGGTVCNPSSGRCVEDNCRGLGCPSGQVCNAITGACETDACATVTCAADQACRAGTCEPSCATTTCAAGETCLHGVCRMDCVPACVTGRVCDLATSTCIEDICTSHMISCPMGTVCSETSGMCESDPCNMLHCPAMQMCQAGECVPMVVMPDGGTSDAGGMDAGHADGGPGTDGGGMTAGGHRVLASGGGGCVCSAGTGGSPRGALVLFALLGVVVWRRRRSGVACRRRRSGVACQRRRSGVACRRRRSGAEVSR